MTVIKYICFGGLETFRQMQIHVEWLFYIVNVILLSQGKKLFL